MTKYVIDTIELIKKQYVVDAYLPDDALELMRERAPIKVEVLSTTVYDIHTVNEYEYNKEWKPGLPDKVDWRPEQREMFEESNDIWRDD